MLSEVTQVDQLETQMLSLVLQQSRILGGTEIIIYGVSKGNVDF